MKCPKCGSELDTGFNCPKCKAKSYKETVSEYNTNGEKIYEKNTVKLVQPDPTPKEMLWWLVENGYTIYRYPHKTRVFGYVHNPLTPNCPFNFGKGEDYATLEDAVRAAYAATKKEVTE